MINVLHPGFFSSIQDLGRIGYQHLGVPISGAMDKHSAQMANAILGNEDSCAVMEITMLGPKLEFTCDSVIVIAGANLSPCLNSNKINNNSVVNVSKGDVLSFGKPISGFRAYLAVSGGFQSEKVLHSRSMYLGITEVSSIKKGDKLKIQQKKHKSKTYAAIKIRTNYLNENVVYVYKGPEFHLLKDEQIAKLFNQEFTISKENNRMAYQLDELITNNLDDIITSLVMPGTVQLTPSGKLIVLLRDCQTTGGYPRILQLSDNSINTIAQKMTGESIKLKLLEYPE